MNPLLPLWVGLSMIVCSVLVVAVFHEVARRDQKGMYLAAFKGMSDIDLVRLIEKLTGDPNRTEYLAAAKAELRRRSKHF